MSAIYGCVSLSENNIGNGITNKMSAYYNQFPHDRHIKYESSSCFIGKLQQNITLNDFHDKYDIFENDRYIISTDVIIDNRDAICHLLSITEENTLSDNELIVKLYLKYEKSIGKYIIGDFAILVFDKLMVELKLFRDHVGCRTIYYYRENDMIYFSTMIEPLKYALSYTNYYNEKWFVEFCAIKSVQQELTEDETIYLSIYHVKPASYITFNIRSTVSKKYWHPERVKKLKYNSYQEAISEFRLLYNKVIDSKIRTYGQIGIQLSGGLDSSSVICTAASSLLLNGRNIHSFNFVPEAKFNLTENDNMIYDESPYVKEIAKAYSNVNIDILDFEGLNALNTMNQIIQCLGMPFKYIENAFWVDGISKKASEKGCKVVLTGQFGNTTISNGNLYDYMVSLALKGSFNQLVTAINEYCKTFHVSRKKFIKFYLKKTIKLFMNRFDNKYWNRHVSLKFIKKYKIKKGMKRIGLNSYRFNSVKNILLKSLNPSILNHVSIPYVCLGLRDALVYRDPTKDKRIIEFMLSLPTEYYLTDGIERSFIKNAMKGLVPECILNNHFKRGIQDGDWALRIENQVDEIDNELLSILSSKEKLPWLDKAELDTSMKADNLDTMSLESKLWIIALNRFFDINK